MIGVMDSVNELTELVGQNRMELLLFKLSNLDQRYGINVFKVREVLPCPHLTVMPKLQRFVMGVAHIRGQTISVIDLALAIGGKPTEHPEKSFIIIAEYNRSTQAFLVSSVERILNMNWNRILPPPQGAGHSNYMTAVTEIDNELVEILDVEKILDEISPAKVRIGVDDNAKAVKNRDSSLENHLKNISIMVADDSMVARKQVKAALKQMGVGNVIEATDGRKALEKLRELASDGHIRDKLNVVISDVEMPEMDGYTLCASIRQDSSLKQLYVILHTSLSGVFNLGMVSKAGANAFIPKFNPDELAESVKKALETVESGVSGADIIMKSPTKGN